MSNPRGEKKGDEREKLVRLRGGMEIYSRKQKRKLEKGRKKGDTKKLITLEKRKKEMRMRLRQVTVRNGEI